MVASRTPNRRAAVALAVGLAALSPGEWARCADHAARAVPENALPPPGQVHEDYPDVGARQKVEIAREVLRSSAEEMARHPARSAIELAGRLGERLAVRGRELMPGAFSAGLGN